MTHLHLHTRFLHKGIANFKSVSLQLPSERDEKENSQIVSVDRVSTLTEKYYYKIEYLSTSKIPQNFPISKIEKEEKSKGFTQKRSK